MFNIDFDVIIVNMEGQILNGNYKSVITWSKITKLNTKC
jgi:hypothetical protein